MIDRYELIIGFLMFTVIVLFSVVASLVWSTHYLWYPSKRDIKAGLEKRKLEKSVLAIIFEGKPILYYRMRGGSSIYDGDHTQLIANYRKGIVAALVVPLIMFSIPWTITFLLPNIISCIILAVTASLIITFVQPEIFTRYAGIRARVTDFYRDWDMPYTLVLWGACISLYFAYALFRISGVSLLEWNIMKSLLQIKALKEAGYFGFPIIAFAFIRGAAASSLETPIFNVKLAFNLSYVLYLVLVYTIAFWARNI